MMTYKKWCVAVITCIAALPVYAQGVPVIDAKAAANFLQQFAMMDNQLSTAKNTLQQAEQLYQGMSGSRGMGDILNNPELRNYLPVEWQAVYDMYGDQVFDILKSEELTGTYEEMQARVEARTPGIIATNKVIGMRGLEGSRERLNQIDNLMRQINETPDQKSIQELQARIAIEQATIQNELVRVQLISQLQQAEQRLAEEQRDTLSLEVFKSTNTGMPTIH